VLGLNRSSWLAVCVHRRRNRERNGAGGATKKEERGEEGIKRFAH
jgi:hypothetical protein